ncbi:MAG TPA: hypothetical protein VMG38_03935 [Trebonia sp.]|nr:hypothetical protein [Trebonia sp.]
MRAFFRRRKVRVVGTVVLVLLAWADFSIGQARDLAGLLQRAGVVEGMQLDINPYWMSYEYYQARGHPKDPTPVKLPPTQQQTAYRYYAPYSRDFTAVYAR